VHGVLRCQGSQNPAKRVALWAVRGKTKVAKIWIVAMIWAIIRLVKSIYSSAPPTSPRQPTGGPLKNHQPTKGGVCCRKTTNQPREASFEEKPPTNQGGHLFKKKNQPTKGGIFSKKHQPHGSQNTNKTNHQQPAEFFRSGIKSHQGHLF